MSDPLLVIDQLSKEFPAPRRFGRPRGPGVRALDDVSVTLGRNEVLGIVGESGSGKSTLARIVVGLVEATSGQVLLDGTPISGLGRLERSRRVQMVFQDPYSSLDPTKTVRYLIEEPLRIHFDLGREERAAKVQRLMQSVALPERMAAARPRQLSGGQRQRVAIARALALEPEILIADEAVSALDVSTQAQVINLLIGIAKERELSYVFVSHDLRIVRQISDRVAVMSAGRIVEQGTCDEVYEDPQSDYTKQLMAAVPTFRRPSARRVTGPLNAAV